MLYASVQCTRALKLQIVRGLWIFVLPLIVCAALEVTSSVGKSTGCACPLVEELSSPPRRSTSVAVCAIFRNEARDLLEWVTYHSLLGIDHFLLYDNESNDAPEHVLAPFIEKGVVTLKHWPGAKADEPSPQSLAMKDCVQVAKIRHIRWITVFDIDEFLVVRSTAKNLCVNPRHNTSWSFELHAALAALETAHVGAILADRYDFGTNGVQNREAHELQTLTFITRDTDVNIWGKPIVLVKAITRFSGFHKVNVKNGWHTKSSCKAGKSCAFDFFHYQTRSRMECTAKSHDPRLPKDNWRRRVGVAECESKRYSKMSDTTLASSNLVSCIANIITTGLRQSRGKHSD